MQTGVIVEVRFVTGYGQYVESLSHLAPNSAHGWRRSLSLRNQPAAGVQYFAYSTVARGLGCGNKLPVRTVPGQRLLHEQPGALWCYSGNWGKLQRQHTATLVFVRAVHELSRHCSDGLSALL